MSSPWSEGECSRSVSVYSRWWTTTHYRPFTRPSKMLVFVFCVLVILPFVCSEDQPSLQGSRDEKGTVYHFAEIDISFIHPDTKKDTKKHFQGKYGVKSLISHISGVVMHALSLSKPNSKSQKTNHSGCSKYVNDKFPSEAWIALVERGDCQFTKKVRIATKVENASAIVVYNNGEFNKIMGHEAMSSISVFLVRKEGLQIAGLLNRGTKVHMSIWPGKEFSVATSMQNSISRTSVLFVSVSFIVLMVVSLAWLVFYYIQRFRYSHAKERLARLLACAAKKAIAKIPQKTIKAGDKELEGDFDQCAVCIEQYKPHDVIRILPCRHVFHKSCIDPWLLDQRSCPMCKLDILRAYGMQVSGSQESVHRDPESGPITQVVNEEPEIRFSREGTRAEVLLVPPTWLHVHAGGDMERDGEEDLEEDKDERRNGQGASPSCHLAEPDADDITVLLSSSSAAAVCNQANVSRAQKKDRDDSVNAETKALISSGSEVKLQFSIDEDEEIEMDTREDSSRLIQARDTSTNDEHDGASPSDLSSSSWEPCME